MRSARSRSGTRRCERALAVDLGPFGYRALDSLRLEKGYRYFGTDMTMSETPDAAGLGMFVRTDKEQFIGRDAVIAARARSAAAPDPEAIRLRTFVIDDRDDFLPVFGGEAVRIEGEVVGRVRSVAYGTTLSRTIGYVYLPAKLQEGSPLTVDVFDQRVPATVSADVLVDPRGLRMRG